MEYSEFLNFREELQQIKESNAFTIDVLEQRLEQRKKALLSRASEHGWDVQRLEDEMRARKAVSSVGKQPAT